MEKRVIMAISDHGTTGISESLRLPLTHWHEQGHEIHQLALGYNGWGQTLDKTMCPWWERMMPIYAATSNEERFGQTCIDRAIAIVKPDIIITAFDVWMINYLSQPAKFKLSESVRNAIEHDKRKFKHIAYFPLDGAVSGEYLPIGMDEAIAGFDIPITYSRFSQNIVRNETNLHVPFIPIAHDKRHYYPGDKAEAKKSLGFPVDKFIIGMVGTNQYRKAWGEFFDAVVPLAKKYDDILILPWTTWDMKIAGGAEIQDFVWRSGVSHKIINPRNGLGSMTDEGMGQLYRALDLCVLTTIGEGAGLPPIRARACGTPALVSANTSNTEFCAHPIEAIPIAGHYYDPFGSNLERYITNVPTLIERLEKLYLDKKLYESVSKKCAAEMEQYERDNVMPYWDQVLERAFA